MNNLWAKLRADGKGSMMKGGIEKLKFRGECSR
jgi:hypothetical protein